MNEDQDPPANRREMAALFLAAFISSHNCENDYPPMDTLVQLSLEYADALIERTTENQ